MNVLTDHGFQLASGIRKTEHDLYYVLKFSTGETIKCTIDHLFDSSNGPINAELLSKKDELIHSEKGHTFLVSKRLIKRKFIAYDLIDAGDNSLYYTNNILSHNCSFLGSSNTLISASKLQHFVHADPIVEQKYLKIYEQPQPGHTYIATVDVCAGLSQDYSVINIVDVTEAPYRQVLVYRNSEIDPTSFSIVVESISKKYNYAHLIIESNNDGKIVAKELWDLEYENLINTQSIHGDNVIKSGKRSVPGIMMTKMTKRIGCSKLKDLIETGVLTVVDIDTISEFGTFSVKKGSYEAEQGKHDDVIMCLVMFAWFTSTIYFEDVSGKNTTSYVKEKRDDEDIYSLLGFIEDGEENAAPSSFW